MWSTWTGGPQAMGPVASPQSRGPGQAGPGGWHPTVMYMLVLVALVAGGAQDAPSDTLTAKHVVIATGSNARQLPGVPFDEKLILSNDGALAIGEAPKKLGVKAAGGIRTYDDVLKMVQAGATRVGASSSVT